jgi:superfamily II DNA or RNA helicase
VTLCNLDRTSSVYQVPQDDLVGEVMIPAFSEASTVKCMVGYFNSLAFRTLAPGLAAFLAQPNGNVRMLASPVLSVEDQDAIREAVADPEEVLLRAANDAFAEARLSEDALVRHHYACLAYLLAAGRLDLRLVMMRNAGLFHPKVWLFEDGEHTIAVHGSSNATAPGLLYNFETVRVERPWRSTDSAETIQKFEALFERLWVGADTNAVVVDLPNAVRMDLLRDGASRPAPTIDEFWAASKTARSGHVKEERMDFASRTSDRRLSIPASLQWEKGAFKHQGEAVRAWESAGCRGILAMATGAGKTVTALICAARQQDLRSPMLVLIAAPYRPLVEQWESEVRAFGMEPLSLRLLPGADRTRQLAQAVRELELGYAKVHVAVITDDYLVDTRLRQLLDSIPAPITVMLVADEVHNLGAPGFVSNPPQRVDLRLGLSATPERQYDDVGTAAIIDFFGDTVYEFDLRQAILSGCLVPYTYQVHPVDLTADEFEEYDKLTSDLIRAGYHEDADGSLSDRVRQLLIRRRAVVENASGKVAALRQLLSASPRNTRHTLIYTSDKNPNQLREVNSLLGHDLDIVFHQLTASETSQRAKSGSILKKFAVGDIQVITCKRVLDEGVNIPQVATAYLLASSTVKRQWVQRRGRILRHCDEIGKQVAGLHDFFVVPPFLGSPAGRSIIRGERLRVLEFAQSALNAGGRNDPFQVLQGIGEIAAT